MESYRYHGDFEEVNRWALEAPIESESWLAGIIDPEKFDHIRQYPAYEGHTPEWVIMDILLAKLIEQGAEMSSIARQRLRSLTAAFRMMVVPNLNSREQKFMKELGAATTVDWSKIEVEVTPELTEDIQWVWKTFELRVPQRQPLPLLIR